MSIVQITDYLDEARGRLPAQFRFTPLPASPVVHVGNGTGFITFTGTPIGQYNVVVTMTSSGAAGTATWGYTINGGTTFVVGASASALLNGTGITATLEGTFANTDTYSFQTGWLGRIDGFLQAWMAECQELENAMWAVFVDRLFPGIDPTGPVDDILNKYGDIVGQPRDGYSNAIYLLLILTRIMANKSDGKHQTLINIASSLVPGVTIFVQEYVGAVIVEPLGTGIVPPATIYTFLQGSQAAGIELIYIVDFGPPDEMFTYTSKHYTSDPTVATQGYSSFYNTALGGLYAGVFQG